MQNELKKRSQMQVGEYTKKARMLLNQRFCLFEWSRKTGRLS